MVLAGVAMFAAGAAPGHELKAGPLVIVHTWVRATPPGATATAAYGKITNLGTVADRLIGASLSGARGAEFRSTTVRAGIVNIHQPSDGIPIPAGDTVELRPGDLSIMFSGLTSPLEHDTYVDGTLTFERAGKIAVEFFVEPRDTTGPAHNVDAHHHERGAPP
jgi:copper(I)-binding protein